MMCKYAVVLQAVYTYKRRLIGLLALSWDSQCAPAFSNQEQKVNGLFYFYIAVTYEKIQNQLEKNLTLGFQKINPQTA